MALNAGVFALLVASAQLAAASPLLAAVLFGGGLLAARALLRREAPKAQPMIPLDLLRVRAFRLSVAASVCCFAGQTAAWSRCPSTCSTAFTSPQ